VDPPLAKPPEMVLIVARRGGSVGEMSVRAGWGSRLTGWAGRLSWRGSCAGRLWSDRGGGGIERDGHPCG